MLYKQLKEVVEKHNVNLVKIFHNGELLDEWDVGSPEFAEREEWYIVGEPRLMQDPATMKIVLVVDELTQHPEGETQLNQILDVEVDVAVTHIPTMQTAHKKLKRRDVPTFIEKARESLGCDKEELIVVLADWESRKLEINRAE